jgi:CheY-like chemotaxis protein
MPYLPNRNIVFVVDDDLGFLKGLKRLLWQYGYDSVLFPSAEAFENHNDFEKAACIILDINLNGACSGDPCCRGAVNMTAPSFRHSGARQRREPGQRAALCADPLDAPRK